MFTKKTEITEQSIQAYCNCSCNCSCACNSSASMYDAHKGNWDSSSGTSYNSHKS